jgi:hypothetical protein
MRTSRVEKGGVHSVACQQGAYAWDPLAVAVLTLANAHRAFVSITQRDSIYRGQRRRKALSRIVHCRARLQGEASDRLGHG